MLLGYEHPFDIWTGPDVAWEILGKGQFSSLFTLFTSMVILAVGKDVNILPGDACKFSTRKKLKNDDKNITQKFFSKIFIDFRLNYVNVIQ